MAQTLLILKKIIHKLQIKREFQANIAENNHCSYQYHDPYLIAAFGNTEL